MIHSENGKDDLGGFRRWVTSLSLDELLDSMAFSFQPDPAPRGPSREACNSGIANSHEYELLLSMVKLQPPPPTPVHPRAPGYKSRSIKGATLDYFFREEENLRWTKPRLFQWAEQESYPNFGGRRYHRSDRRNGSRKRRFGVIARKKVAPWGTIYGLGSTQEQRKADCQLIQGTRLGKLRRDGKYHATACFVSSGERERNGGSTATATSVLQMLQIASRGHFFQQNPTQNSEVPYYAPWLQPTERWFSLSMYLASRFQMALWDSFLKHQSNQGRSLEQLGRLIRDGGNWRGYNESMLRDALMRSIRLGIIDMLKEEKADSGLNYLRDGTLWSILEGHRKKAWNLPEDSDNVEGDWKALARAWTQIQLVDIHSPFRGKFKSLISQKLEEELVAQMEWAVFVDNKPEPLSNSQDVGVQAAKKKRKKKKKKSKRINGSKNTTPSLAVVGEEGDPIPVEEEKTPTDPPTDHSNTKYGFPKNSITALERNQNIILVLGILEDVTEEVFSRVGLAKTPKFDNAVQDTKSTPVSRKSNSKPNSTTSKPLPKPKPTIPISSLKGRNLTQIPKVSRKEENQDKSNQDLNTSNEISPQSFTPGPVQTSRSLDQEFTTQNDVNAFSLYTEQIEEYESSMYNPFATGSDFSLSNFDDIGGYAHNWQFANRFPSRERSILTNFFESQNEKTASDEDNDDEDERLMASSTAASIASSTYKDTAYVAETEELSVPSNVITTAMDAIRETEDASSSSSDESGKSDHSTKLIANEEEASSVGTSAILAMDEIETMASLGDDEDRKESTPEAEQSENGNEPNDDASGCRSPTLHAPSTPPPTLSPIVVSLADLKEAKMDDLKKIQDFRSLDFMNATSNPGPGSLPPNSPKARDDMDIRIKSFKSFRDDHQIKSQQKIARRRLEIPSYRSVAVKALKKSNSFGRDDSESRAHDDMQLVVSLRRRQHQRKDSCAQSETAIDTDHRENQDWYREEFDHQSLAKDETTTIISDIPHRVEVESEELALVREERNNFRDMCLTLGAEVAKLKVMLATQQAAAAAPADFQDQSSGYSNMYGRQGSFDQNGMQPFFHGMRNGLRAGPKSDAGFHRYGDHESIFSEDEAFDHVSKTNPNPNSVQYMTSSQTVASHTVAHSVAESDASIDFNSIKPPLPMGQVGSITAFDSFHFNGLQSRLTKDILQFLETTKMNMKKLDGRRNLAVQRFSRLVKTVWPRAQIKLYGSYISGLCLPSSDLDIVVCLPAVHKKDLALAPGVLEGRNAINETSQKLLARELKGESWIDPRSLKVIERTAVPVIKVSTKDTRARMIQLDISFDGPEHHGIDANRLVSQILEELPLIRPLMLVLKQFLLHRGLLTAYTGGLSSYCLFLMLARYLQEQTPSNGDCGSLLMGFLDFYGNHFDPRAIGISVGGRRYFARANSNNAAAGYEPTGQPIWNRSHPPHQNRVVINNLPPSSNSVVFRRRNSFSDTGSVDGSRQRPRFFAKPSTTSTNRFVPLGNSNDPSPHSKETNYRNTGTNNTAIFSGYDRPSTFDPLFVEDPLSATNNVGRNAFRINQVQRAFSDAHRALVASLDWDMHAAEGNGKYPLLKCLLGNQREDVLYGI